MGTKTIIDRNGVQQREGRSSLEVRVPMAAPEGVSPNKTAQNESGSPLQGNVAIVSPGHYFLSSAGPGVTGSLPQPSAAPGALYSFVDVGDNDTWDLNCPPGPGVKIVESGTDNVGLTATMPAGGCMVLQSMGTYFVALAFSGSITLQS